MLGLVPTYARTAMRPEGKQPMSNRTTKKDLNGGRIAGATEFTEARQIKYLRELAKSGRKTHSALCAGVSYDQVRNLRKADSAFAKLCEEAEGIFADSLIEEATRRARDGWDEPVYQKGHRVHEDCGNCRGAGREMEIHTDASGEQSLSATGPICDQCKGTGKGEPAVVRRYDPQLMGTMLKGYDSRFREKQETNVTVTGGALLVPMDPESAEAWHKQYSQQPAIDVTDESRALNPALPPVEKK